MWVLSDGLDIGLKVLVKVILIAVGSTLALYFLLWLMERKSLVT